MTSVHKALPKVHIAPLKKSDTTTDSSLTNLSVPKSSINKSNELKIEDKFKKDKTIIYSDNSANTFNFPTNTKAVTSLGKRIDYLQVPKFNQKGALEIAKRAGFDSVKDLQKALGVKPTGVFDQKTYDT